jgi:hypothetical protein
MGEWESRRWGEIEYRLLTPHPLSKSSLLPVTLSPVFHSIQVTFPKNGEIYFLRHGRCSGSFPCRRGPVAMACEKKIIPVTNEVKQLFFNFDKRQLLVKKVLDKKMQKP